MLVRLNDQIQGNAFSINDQFPTIPSVVAWAMVIRVGRLVVFVLCQLNLILEAVPLYPGLACHP